MMYVLLGDLDHAQHSLGAVNNPQEWVEGPLPALPDGCEQKPRYRLVSKRNPRLYKEPVLDLIRDVDIAFGQLMQGLVQGGHLDNAAVVLVSDHNMVNYLYRKNILEKTDVAQKLEDAGLAPEHDFFFYGAGSIGLLYWRPEYKLTHPLVVARAKAELLSLRHFAYNHERGRFERPWGIMDLEDMMDGRPDLVIGPMEFYHEHFVQEGLWPDLAVVMKHGWQIPSGSFNIGGGVEFTLFNAGHGAPDTNAVMLAIWGLGYPRGAVCAGDVTLADVGVTIAERYGWTFPFDSGTPLECISP
jgi:hypothetical protein